MTGVSPPNGKLLLTGGVFLPVQNVVGSLGMSKEAEITTKWVERSVPESRKYIETRPAQRIELDPNDRNVARYFRRTRRVRGRIVDPRERHFDHLVVLVQALNYVSMHFSEEDRATIYDDLDHLLSWERWESDVPLPTKASFEKYLRFLIHYQPLEIPHLGASEAGDILAAWLGADSRLFVEFPGGGSEIRWSYSEVKETAPVSMAGQIPLNSVFRYLQPLNPARWFRNGKAATPA